MRFPDKYVVADAKDFDLINFGSDNISDCIDYCKKHPFMKYPDYVIMHIMYTDPRKHTSWVPLHIFDTQGKFLIAWNDILFPGMKNHILEGSENK